MSESYIVTFEIPVSSVDTKHIFWVCFRFLNFNSKESFWNFLLSDHVQNTTEKSVCAKLFTISSSSTFENGDVREAHAKGASN